MNEHSRRKWYRIVLGVAALSVGVAIGLTLVLEWPGQPQREQAVAPSSAQEKQPGVTIRRPLLKHMEGGQLVWQAQLQELQVASGGQIVEAKGLEEAIIYGQAGAPLVRMTADKISGHTGHRDFTISGNVRVVSYRAAIITTDNAIWNQEQQRIACPGKVTLKTQHAVITTTNLEYFVAQDLVKCPEQVQMYAGDNTVVGKKLQYNVATGDSRLEKVTMVLHAEEAKEKWRELQQQ